MTLKPLSLPPPPLMGTTPPQHRATLLLEGHHLCGDPPVWCQGTLPPPPTGDARPRGAAAPRDAKVKRGLPKKVPGDRWGHCCRCPLPVRSGGRGTSVAAVVVGLGVSTGEGLWRLPASPRPHFSPSPRPISPVPISRYVPHPTSPRSRFLRPHVPGVPAPHPLVPPSPNPVLPIS